MPGALTVELGGVQGKDRLWNQVTLPQSSTIMNFPAARGQLLNNPPSTPKPRLEKQEQRPTSESYQDSLR